MEIHLDCLPCFLKQVLEASRMATGKIELHEAIMKEAVGLILNYKQYRCSPEVGRDIHRIIKMHTGNIDPYHKIKKENIKTALKVYPLLKYFLFKKPERLYWALKTAAVGNIIDSAIYKDLDIEGCVEEELEREFSICDIEQFEGKLKNAKRLLILGDNAGETVFDRVLIEEFLHMDITYAVRSEPIINDATVDDACASGLDKCTRIISTGCNAPGLILEECNQKFMDVFNNADIVISKGQGNYEALSDESREMFFLLKAKCPVIAEKLGVDVNDYVFKWNGFGNGRRRKFETEELLTYAQNSIKIDYGYKIIM